jgi:hypothetical protein
MYRAAGRIALIALCLSPSLATACLATKAGEFSITAESVTLLMSLQPTSPAVGKPFEVHVRLCDDSQTDIDGQLSGGALMPAHGHGMNYRPPTVAVAKGRATLTGFLLHMPGKWAFEFTLRRDGTSIHFRIPYLLTP